MIIGEVTCDLTSHPPTPLHHRQFIIKSAINPHLTPIFPVRRHFYKFQMYCSVSPLPSVHHFHRFLFHRVLHEIYLALTAIQLRVDSMVISSASCSVQCRPSALNSNMVAVTSILAIGQPISAHRITNHCDVSTTRKWLSIRSVFWPTIGVNAAKTMLKEVKCA